MRCIVIIGMCLSLFSPAVQAETMYVSELMEITLRTGPEIDHKIISMLKSGQKVETIIPGDEWTMVSLPSGREGWVLSRFITPSLPSSRVLNELKEKHKTLTIQAVSLFEENTMLKEENQRLATELASREETYNKIKQSYETLKTESSDFFKLKSNYEKTASQLIEKTKKAEKLEEEATQLYMSRNIRWFLSGAGVLILGFLIGFSSKRQSRRSSFL